MRTSLTLAIVGAAICGSLLVAHVDDSKIFDRIPSYQGPGYRAAEGGLAGGSTQFDANGVVLLSWLPLSEFGSGINNANVVEGYVSQSGREYALLGISSGVGFVEVTDPGNAQVVAVLPGPESLWRDIRTFGPYAYAGSEGGGGIQVFDLNQIDSGIVTQINTIITGGNLSTHTIFVDKASGFLYRAGGGSNGIRIYSLINPTTPVLVGQWQDRYTHEVTVVTYPDGPYAGKQIAFCCGGFNGGFVNSGLSIVDVTDKSNIIVLSNYEYPNAQYSHQGWLTEDRKYFILNDEKDEQNLGIPGTSRILNVENLSAPFQAATWTNGNPAIDHNLYMRGTTAFLSNYRSGLRVVDVADPLAPVEIAYFDTFPGSDSPNFNGLWDNDPFLPSGIVLGSDIERGLFVWYVGATPLTFTFPSGLPTLLAPAGQTIRAVIDAAEGLAVEKGSVVLNVQTSAGLVTVPAVEVEANTYEALSPALECGEALSYSFAATSSNGLTVAGPQPGVDAIAAVSETVGFTDNFERNLGWTIGAAGDNATSGVWTRVDPNGTTAQPEDDNPAGTGALCFITGQGPVGGSAGEADVDNGSTSLVSPNFDAVTGAEDGDEPVIEYYRWYSNNLGGAPGLDSMPVHISNNGGATWTLLETVSENASAWVRKSFRIADFVTPTAQIRLKFVARDLDGGSLVEAGVDDVRIVRFGCVAAIVGDLDGDGDVDGADLGELLANWGTAGGDLDGDGVTDGSDLGILLSNWG